MTTTQAAMLIPFDPYNRTYMVVRSTNWHPVSAFRHRLKGIGGVIEAGEVPSVAVARELDEEQPGWFERIPGTSKKFGEAPITAENGLHSVGTFEEKGIHWHLFIAPTDLGLHSFRKARAVATESTPEIWSLGSVPAEADCLPGFREVIRMAQQRIAQAYPSLGLVIPD